MHIGEKCECGSIYTKIEYIEGRSDDIFKFKDIKGRDVIIFPDQIRNSIIIASKKVLNYRVIQTSENIISISLLFEDDENFSEDKDKIFKAIQQLLKSKEISNIKILYKKWEMPELDKKFRRIINMSSKN